MAKRRYVGVYNITMTSRITCVYREQWYVIITFDLTWTQSVRPSRTRNCGIRHVTVPIATRILIANVRHIGLSNICVINLVYFKMQV